MDHPDAAFRVLVEDDPTKAYGYVQELNALNQARTEAVRTMMELARQAERALGDYGDLQRLPPPPPSSGTHLV